MCFNQVLQVGGTNVVLQTTVTVVWVAVIVEDVSPPRIRHVE